MSDLSPLPGEIQALIAAEADAPVPADRAAVRARVLATVGIAAGTAIATSGAASAAATSAGAASTAGAGAGAAAVASGITGKILVIAIAATVVGGTAVIVTRDDPAPRATHVGAVAPAQPPAPSQPAAQHAAPAPIAPSSPAPPAVSPPASKPRPVDRAPSPPAVVEPEVDDQPTLLHRAWDALGRGDAAAALDAVELDATHHPDGPLAEEREALRIDALLRLSRTDEARDRARAFAARYPDSIHRDLVARALGDAP